MKKFIEKIEALDNITQWSERDSIIKETVSQHSFKVAAIANYLLQKIELEIKINDNVKFARFKYNVLAYAIMHDFDEAIFGRDVSHIVKYNKFNGDEVRKAIDDYVEHILETEFDGLVTQPTMIVKKFVKVCDWIALLTFVQRNQNMGAKTFDNEERYCVECLAKAVECAETLLNDEYLSYIDLSVYIKDLIA
jgi:5'-deoxynucleotidase YfbR-like HD superfamily hydrolase